LIFLTLTDNLKGYFAKGVLVAIFVVPSVLGKRGA
jgi:hypothetical protein